MAHKTDVRFSGTCITYNPKLDTQAQLLTPKLIKVSCIIKSFREVMSNTLYRNFQALLRYSMISWVGIIKVITYLN